MPFCLKDDEEQTTVQITGAFDVYQVSEFCEQLRSCLATRNKVALDLSGISDCDTAGIQVLCSTFKSTKQMGKELVVLDIPVSVHKAASNVGIRLLEDFDIKEKLTCQK
jgi:anti-anti-sigma factor